MGSIWHVIFLLMKSAKASCKRCLTCCHFFTPLQGVILYPAFPDMERRLPGQPGSYSTTQQMFSFRWVTATVKTSRWQFLETVKRFVVLLYDRGSTKNGVKEARQQMFAQKGRGLDAIPPTKEALFQHTKRAVYQAGHCWGQACNTNPQLPYSRSWEWLSCSNGQEPLWTTLPDVTASSRELVKCGCKKGCHGNCLCVKATLKCTALCSCSGECH